MHTYFISQRQLNSRTSLVHQTVVVVFWTSKMLPLGLASLSHSCKHCTEILPLTLLFVLINVMFMLPCLSDISSLQHQSFPMNLVKYVLAN